MSSCITVQIRWISNQLKCIGQFYTTVQTFQQFSHFSTSSTRKWYPFGRQDNRKQNFLSRIFMSRIFIVHDRPIILYRFCVSHRVRWQWETSAIFRYFWWTTSKSTSSRAQHVVNSCVNSRCCARMMFSLHPVVCCFNEHRVLCCGVPATDYSRLPVPFAGGMRHISHFLSRCQTSHWPISP